jgi:hypothetical protein
MEKPCVKHGETGNTYIGPDEPFGQRVPKLSSIFGENLSCADGNFEHQNGVFITIINYCYCYYYQLLLGILLL